MRAIIDRDNDVPAPSSRQNDSTRSRAVATATSRASGTSPDDSKPRKISPSRPSCCFQDPVGPQDSGRGQGQNLAAAVADHGVGDQTEPGQQSMQGALRSQDEFTAVAVDQRSSPPSGLDCTSARSGAHFTELECDPVGDVEHATDVGKVQAQVGEHAGILRAFPREEKGHASRACLQKRLVPEVNPAAVADGMARQVARRGSKFCQSRGQIGE